MFRCMTSSVSVADSSRLDVTPSLTTTNSPSAFSPRPYVVSPRVLATRTDLTFQTSASTRTLWDEPTCGVQSSVALMPHVLGLSASDTAEEPLALAFEPAAFEAFCDWVAVPLSEAVPPEVFLEPPPVAAPMIMSRTNPPARYFFICSRSSRKLNGQGLTGAERLPCLSC